ncbi:hypothetical protein Psta_1203 [Pirellula staleyi DSM 6068]|uniref:Uncharacterized protein n=1 Tax=Pirellula staleyi (strain ATCC 27377 / DSM 6068 / ICPB 4128) TaxID=530564 RepID=D2R954_PIRSD|nr:hypothetical protein Psta_1203 [Pirellula staleyi DSM 6068]
MLVLPEASGPGMQQVLEAIHSLVINSIGWLGRDHSGHSKEAGKPVKRPSKCLVGAFY